MGWSRAGSDHPTAEVSGVNGLTPGAWEAVDSHQLVARGRHGCAWHLELPVRAIVRTASLDLDG